MTERFVFKKIKELIVECIKRSKEEVSQNHYK